MWRLQPRLRLAGVACGCSCASHTFLHSRSPPRHACCVPTACCRCVALRLLFRSCCLCVHDPCLCHHVRLVPVKTMLSSSMSAMWVQLCNIPYIHTHGEMPDLLHMTCPMLRRWQPLVRGASSLWSVIVWAFAVPQTRYMASLPSSLRSACCTRPCTFSWCLCSQGRPLLHAWSARCCCYQLFSPYCQSVGLSDLRKQPLV